MKHEHRAIQMLLLASEYIKKHAPEETINYDETQCDGRCLAEDCENAAFEVAMLIREKMALEKEIVMHQKFQENINRALNEGNGTYKP